MLFVVPSAARLAWLRRTAPASTRAWAVTLSDLERAGLDAPVRSLGRPGASSLLRALLADVHQRWCPTPVGSPAWVELLGSGGGHGTTEQRTDLTWHNLGDENPHSIKMVRNSTLLAQPGAMNTSTSFNDYWYHC